MILLDTNVISELLKVAPSPQVAHWLDEHFAESAISSVTAFELIVGVVGLQPGRRRDALDTAVGRILRRFSPRTYAFDGAAAQVAARLFESSRQHGLPLHQLPGKYADLQIAGIAIAYGLSLATRNTRDFRDIGIDLIDPWQPASA